jgi:uncharacterized protein (DUF305 family)
MKNTTTLLYIIIALLVMLLLTRLYSTNRCGHKMMMLGGMTHQMSNGTMMEGGTHMSMDSMMNGMMAGLQGKTGNEFDKAFLSEMITHHQGAVVMAQAVLQSSKRPELVKLANDIISAQTKEIEMMKGWQKSWFNFQN